MSPQHVVSAKADDVAFSEYYAPRSGCQSTLSGHSSATGEPMFDPIGGTYLAQLSWFYADCLDGGNDPYGIANVRIRNGAQRGPESIAWKTRPQGA
jgi:hypothetical protein